MTFIWPWMSLTLILIPLAVGWYVRLLRRRQQSVTALGTMGLLQQSSGGQLGRRRHVPPLFFLFGVGLLLVALARPEMEVNLPRIEGTVILAFDVSSSMAADDLEPTRIEAAQAAARSFVAKQPPSILIGVVAFSNGGLVVQPPTADQTAVLETIDRLQPQGGTSLGQGIFTSLNAIAGEPIALGDAALEEGLDSVQLDQYPSAVMLLLTDGENTGPPDPLAIAQLAAEAGVRIYAVGIGSREGTVLEIDGFNVVTQLNETTLQDIAGLTNGAYFHAADEGSLQEIYENVDLQFTIAGEKMEVTAVFAGISFLLLLLGAGLSLLWWGRVPL